MNRTTPLDSEIEKCILNEKDAILNITTLERPDEKQVDKYKYYNKPICQYLQICFITVSTTQYRLIAFIQHGCNVKCPGLGI